LQPAPCWRENWAIGDSLPKHAIGTPPAVRPTKRGLDEPYQIGDELVLWVRRKAVSSEAVSFVVSRRQGSRALPDTTLIVLPVRRTLMSGSDDDRAGRVSVDGHHTHAVMW
jgi:hypothetical protein